MSATTLYVPCDVVRVRVTLGYGDRLSPIEAVMMDAVYTRPDGAAVEELLNLFKLSERVTLDMLGDLLRRGYIVVDFGTAMIRLAPGIDRNALARLRGAERFNSSVDLLVDRLVGGVFTVEDGRRRSADFRFEVPAPLAAYHDRVTEAQLLAVLDRAVEQEAPRGADGTPSRARKVLAAHLAADNLINTVDLRWLPLDVTIHTDGDDRLRFAVSDRRFTVAQRELAATRLAKLAADLPKHRFVQALESCVDRAFVEPPPLHQLLTRFAKRTAEAAGAVPGTRVRRHHDLKADYDSIANELRAVRAAEVEAFVVGGKERHDDLVAQLIAAANRQLVLVCPVLHHNVLLSYFRPLTEALERGVQVFLIWGDGRESELPSKVRTALSQLDWNSTRSRMLSSTMPSRLNASTIIVDDRQALVTGYHFLRTQDPSQLQLGVHLAAADAAPCQPIESLLLWARRTLQHHQGELMKVRSSEFVMEPRNAEVADPLSPRAAAPPLWPDSEAPVPALPPETEADELTASQLKLWVKQWQAAAAQLARVAAGRTIPRVRLVEDGAHRELLWDTLRARGKRLVIGGYQAHPDALDPRLLKALGERAAAKCRVSISYHRSKAGVGDVDGTLNSLGGNPPVAAQRRPTNARALVSDDQAVVTSFDFLGNSGRSGASHRDRAELGLQVTSRRIADEIAQFFGLTVEEPIEPAVELRTAEPAAAEFSNTARLLAAVAHLPVDDRADIVVAHLGGKEDDWRLLDDLRHADAPVDILRVCAAAVLGRTTDRDEERAQRWLRWLVKEAWRRGAFVEASVLRTAVLDPNVRPRTAVATAVAARYGPRLGSAVMDAWTDDLSPAEQTTLAVVAAGGLLLAEGRTAQFTDLAANDVPSMLSMIELTGVWAEFVSATVHYWKGTSGPLPLAVITTDNADSNRREILNGAWQDLTTAVDQCRKAHLGFNLTSRFLFEKGSYQPLATAVQARDINGVRAWIDGAGGTEAQEQFSVAENEAAGRRKPTPVGRTLPFVERMRRIQAAARELIRSFDEEINAVQDARTEPAREFARRLQQLWPRLQEAASNEPEMKAVSAMLDDLAFVERWDVR